MPKMTHPNSRHTITATDEQVPMYRSQGWQVAGEGSAPKQRRRRSTKKATASKPDAAK